jgi:cytochrome c-type biogenesis protein CcmH
MRYALALSLMILGLTAAPRGTVGFAATSPKTSVQEVGEGLTCQCGCGLTVANCNHPSCGFAVPMREEILRMIGKGMTRAEILASYRHQYGEKVLSAPTMEGFNLLAWIIPYVAVGSGVLLILIAVVRWRGSEEAARSIGKPPGASGDDEFEAGLRQRLERDLHRQL